MIIGIPKEIKKYENRVGMTPSGVNELVLHQHPVYVETAAGTGSGFTDEEYAEAGAVILNTAAEVWRKSDLIVKVKEPLPAEFPFFRENQTLFTYLHLAPEPELTDALLNKKVTAIAYETVQLADNSLPLLSPMSEVAGRMAVQIGAACLQKNNGGKGILLGGVPGVLPAEVTIIGGGVVGTNAARMAVGAGAGVTVLDIAKKRVVELDEIFKGRVKTLICNQTNLKAVVKNTDLLIGAVLIPGAKAPKLVTREMVQTMQKGSVIVDVAVDQGACVETIDRVTYHDHPTYEAHGVIHYAVANMPGAVPRTSTIALTNATLPYVIKLADAGVEKAFADDPALRKGLNTYQGFLTNEPVAVAQNKKFMAYEYVK